MREPSNLPPGVTDSMIEEAQGEGGRAMTEATPVVEPTFNQAHNHILDKLHYEARHRELNPLICGDRDCVMLRRLIAQVAHFAPLVKALEECVYELNELSSDSKWTPSGLDEAWEHGTAALLAAEEATA